MNELTEFFSKAKVSLSYSTKNIGQISLSSWAILLITFQLNFTSIYFFNESFTKEIYL